MKLNKEDLRILNSCCSRVKVKQVDLCIGSYYVKFGYDNVDTIKMIFRELLGTKVFNLVGIKCAQYQYVQESECLISEDLNRDKKMYWCYELGFGSLALEYVLEGIHLQKHVGDGFANPEKLTLSVEIMHFIDILFSNVDRHANNFGFYIDKNGYGELVVFDNEGFLRCYESSTKPYAFSGQQVEEGDCSHITKKEEAIKFFEMMSEEMKMLVPKYLEMFTPTRVEHLIHNLETDTNLQFPEFNETMKKYKKNYKMVSNVFGIKKKINIVNKLIKK